MAYVFAIAGAYLSALFKEPRASIVFKMSVILKQATLFCRAIYFKIQSLIIFLAGDLHSL